MEIYVYDRRKNEELNNLTIWDPLMIDFSFEIGEQILYFYVFFDQ